MSLPAPSRRHGGFSSRSLAKAIFAAEVPEQFVRSIPAQSLFMAVKQNGLAASADIMEIATLEQCRLMLDFDCWEGDQFSEERFWEWLSLTDEDSGLKILQKLLRFVDLKVIALLISRYIEVQVFEEPTENPPGPGFHTPDKGYTWIGINAPDADKHFLLARLMALVFETEAELFYQLISIPNVSTPTLLEEDSFQERTKRLAAEGIPDAGWAFKINTPLSPDEFKRSLGGALTPAVSDIAIIEPIVYESALLQPLGSLLDAITDRETAEMEMTLIANAALVHWGVDFGDHARVIDILGRVKGALNIGLERALELRADMTPRALYEAVGLQPLYRLGLYDVLDLQKAAKRVGEKHPGGSIDEAHWTIVRDGLLNRFPAVPMFVNSRGELEASPAGAVSPELRPFEHLAEIKAVKSLL